MHDFNPINLIVPKAGTSVSIAGAISCSSDLICAQFIAHNDQTPTLIIVPDDFQAQKLSKSLTLFSDNHTGRRIHIFPSTSAMPYTRMNADPIEQSGQIACLFKLINHEPIVLIVPISSFLMRVPPKSFFSNAIFTVQQKDNISVQQITEHLVLYGYEEMPVVEDIGTFSRRGNILDIWSPNMPQPMRIEWDFDIIDQITPFNPVSQRSKRHAESENNCTILPAALFAMNKSNRDKAAHHIRQLTHNNIPATTRKQLIENIHTGISFSGINTFLPLFHNTLHTICDYLPNTASTIFYDQIKIEDMCNRTWHRIQDLYKNTQSIERIISPDQIIVLENHWSTLLKEYSKIYFNPSTPDSQTHIVDITSNLAFQKQIESMDYDHMFRFISDYIRQWMNSLFRVIIVCHSESQCDQLHDILSKYELNAQIYKDSFTQLLSKKNTCMILTGDINSGFRWDDQKLIVLTESDIFGKHTRKQAPPPSDIDPFRSLAELTPNDYIVHEKHGIGRYLGLSHLTIATIPGDYILLEYIGGDKLYVPAYRLGLIGKYISSRNTPPMLDKLGGVRWKKITKKAQEDIRKMANELLTTFAKRKLKKGHAFPSGGFAYEEFSTAFPFDETPDQSKAIADIMADLDTDKPSDRLICGDVGYGKTEVAMRAAFRAAISGKQVAILTPTTVLAFQHFESFKERFKHTALTIDMLSRFRSIKERNQIKETIYRGTLDIVIGTHSLLQKNISFKNLGLLIVDEEHRFGVSHKERIKELKATVDIISMTATPIPRTLNLSLTGIRDISIINTPPASRQSIATYVTDFDDVMIMHAIHNELNRDGQVFFIHNRVETIYAMYERLHALLPDVRIGIGHGQLKESELEKVMIDFLHHRTDVLLCTTIVESGLDIPNANTIIIHRADTFGLAQLYQLRGRVGRSDKKAYAYLLTPADSSITPLAKKRLQVIKRYSDLGSGFQIAMHDLEFRGAGNILGSAQSGHIHAVGYELYSKLLERTVRKLKGEIIHDDIDPELSIGIPAFFPENYISDINNRIECYRRLSGCRNNMDIDVLYEEFTDRYGSMPINAQNLIELMRIRLIAIHCRIEKVSCLHNLIHCKMHKSTPLSGEIIIKLMQKKNTPLKITSPDTLSIDITYLGYPASLTDIKNALSELTSYVS